MLQVWLAMMRSCEMRGKDLLDAGAITPADLNSFLKAKGGNEASVISVGLPCYSFLQSVLNSIKAGSDGFLLLDGTELTHLNRPNDKLFDWFFQPLMVLKEQIRVIKLEEGEERFLQRVVLYGNDTQRMETWDNGSLVPQEALRAAQIQGITRRYKSFCIPHSKLLKKEYIAFNNRENLKIGMRCQEHSHDKTSNSPVHSQQFKGHGIIFAVLSFFFEHNYRHFEMHINRVPILHRLFTKALYTHIWIGVFE